MDSQPSKLETVREEEWQIVANDWWHTSFDLTSWSYTPEDPAYSSAKPPHCHGTLLRACGARFVPSDAFSPRNQLDLDSHGLDVTLNPDLCGVQCALEVIAPYEADVGFLSVESQFFEQKRRVDISIEVVEEDITLTRERWNTSAEYWTSGLGLEKDGELGVYARGNETSRGSSPTSSHGGLHRSTSTLSSVDLTDSDLSFHSISTPSTPKGKSSEAIIEVKDASPPKSSNDRYSVVSFSGRPLNASASSFIPSITSPMKDDPSLTPYSPPSPQPAFVNFTFPSLDVPLPSGVKLKKDEQGFYSKEETGASVAESVFLPAFLQTSSPRRKTTASKTRAIIDRFRSFNQHQAVGEGSNIHSHSPSPNPPLYDVNLLDERQALSEGGRAQSGLSSPSSLDEDDDGWINLAEVDAASQESKARRTRNLFLALTRRRSTPPDQMTEGSPDEHRDMEIPRTSSPTSLPSPLSSSNDGWIDGSSTIPKSEIVPPRRTESRSRSHRKRRSSHVPPAPPSNVLPYNPSTATRPALGLHPPPFSAPVHYPARPPYIYATYPAMMTPVAYANYMQLQLMHMQLRGGGPRAAIVPNSNEWFHYPNTAPNVPSPTNPSAMRRESLW